MIPSIPKITINSRLGDIVLEPVRMGRLEAFSQAVEPIIGEVFSVLEDSENSKKNIFQMISKHTISTVNFVCVACPEITKEKIDDMFTDEFIDLIGGVIEVNADFFAQNLLPVIKNRVESIKGKIPQNLLKNKSGQTDTSALSPTATA